MGYDKLACKLGKWRIESHDGFWFINDNHDGYVKDRCYEIEGEYRL